MTPIQRQVVDRQVALGFKVVQEAGGVVRLSKGGDKRLVRANGELKRANHIDRKADQ